MGIGIAHALDTRSAPGLEDCEGNSMEPYSGVYSCQGSSLSSLDRMASTTGPTKTVALKQLARGSS